MPSLFVAVTDGDWFAHLAAQPALDEVNFWQPSGTGTFKALQPGELFLFKLHSPRNFIVGGGLFAHSTTLPLSMAWEAFGPSNGVASLDDMRRRTARYRREVLDPRQDYVIGCRLIEEPFFFSELQWIPVPASWSRNIVVGKTFGLDTDDGRYIWDAVQERAGMLNSEVAVREGERFGAPSLVLPRLGQGGFRVLVTDAYRRRCSVTGERTLPALEAAHIRPYADGGAHDVRNGLLLRSDLHKLFDRGYVTVSSEGAFEVSHRIRVDFENGRDYYALHGARIAEPTRPELKPMRDALEWHQTHAFLG